MNPQDLPAKVVYLFGAGASHACLKAVGSSHGILMSDLGEPLRERIHKMVSEKYSDVGALTSLVNTVIDEDTDFEHIITFLDESTSELHRRFANDLRDAFETVLREKLDRIAEELGGPPVDLYEALLDMYEVDGCPEKLGGILTINYDEYIEEAIKRLGGQVDFGVQVQGVASPTNGQRLLKLHGSFGWEYAWPIPYWTEGKRLLWIPPGIQKAKNDYPFNLLWGQARELLDCDVLRIIGCRLAPNDWDLISLLFTTRHTHSNRDFPYAIEVINSPKNAQELREAYPYLNVQSILETKPVGKQLVSEFLGGEPREFEALALEEQNQLIEGVSDRNWFRLWLVQMAEHLYSDLGSVETASGAFQRLLESN